MTHDEHSSHHILPIRVYITVFVLLMVLLVLTYVAALQNFGVLNNVVALTIAVVKALLVILYFMHVRFSTRLTWIYAAAGFVWFLLLFITFGDYWTRSLNVPAPKQWEPPITLTQPKTSASDHGH